jgi:hypothetical protein
MANAAKKKKEQLIPLKPAEFSLFEHSTRKFNATVPGGSSEEDLENPDLWVNCAQKMEMGDEVRCLADDMSFVAYGICTFVQGSVAKIKIIAGYELDAVDYEAVADEASNFECKQRGPKKWCIINKKNGDIVKEMIPTQLQAMKELADYQKALRT